MLITVLPYGTQQPSQYVADAKIRPGEACVLGRNLSNHHDVANKYQPPNTEAGAAGQDGIGKPPLTSHVTNEGRDDQSQPSTQ